MDKPEKQSPRKIPLSFNDFQTASQFNDVVGMVCRKKGPMSVEACGQCLDFEPAVKGVKDGDVMEGMNGIDPHTGNSYATCKYFGEIVRADPFYAMVRRLQERKFGKW